MPRTALGLSAIDTALDLEGIVAPAGVVAATYVGQRYWNTAGAAGSRLYFATAIGAAGVATWSAAATGV